MRWAYKHLLRVLAEIRKSGFEMQAKWIWTWQLDGERFKDWDGAPIKNVLDAMGREGWEMISVSRLEGDATEYYFKKQIAATAKMEPVSAPKGAPVMMPSPVKFARASQASSPAPQPEPEPAAQEQPTEGSTDAVPAAPPANPAESPAS